MLYCEWIYCSIRGDKHFPILKYLLDRYKNVIHLHLKLQKKKKSDKDVMACFIYMFVSPLFQCSFMCLLEVKKTIQIQSDVAAFKERSSDRAVQGRP